MTTLSSPAAVAGTAAPFNNPSQKSRLVGVRKVLTRAEFDAAITAERDRGVGSGIYADGEQFQISGEAGYRTWNLAGLHARSITLLPGFVVTLGSDSNTALMVTSYPSVMNGTDGDVRVDFASGVYYLKTGGAYVCYSLLPSKAAQVGHVSYEEITANCNYSRSAHNGKVLVNKGSANLVITMATGWQATDTFATAMEGTGTLTLADGGGLTVVDPMDQVAAQMQFGGVIGWRIDQTNGSKILPL